MIIRPVITVSLIAVILLSGLCCAQSDTVAVEIRGGDRHQVELNGSRIYLSFASVVSNERCPALVTCSWANPPVVIISAAMAGKESQDFQITAGGPKGELQGNYAGYVIRFLDLTPAPQLPSDFSKVISLEKYTVTLNIISP